jgi:hypothetical protein
VDHNGTHDVLCNDSPDPEKQIQRVSNSPQDLESSAELIQTSAETPPQAPEHPDSLRTGAVEKSQTIAVNRKDKHRLHSMRHAVLSRYPLEALAHLGENIRQLRNLERTLRTELKPSGVVGAMVFDRLWSSYLRCLLAARAEAVALSPTDRPAELPGRAAVIREDELPTLISNDHSQVNEVFSTDLIRQLALVERYDRHFSREMYRALTMLLVAKSGGQAGLERCLGRALGFNINSSEGSANE